MTSSTTSRNRQLLAMSVFMLISKFIVLTFENETNFATQRRWSLCNDVKVFWFLYLGKWFVWQAVNRTPDGALPTRWQEALAEDMGVACAAVHDGKQHTSAHFCYWGTFSIMGVFHDTILVKKKKNSGSYLICEIFSIHNQRVITNCILYCKTQL